MANYELTRVDNLLGRLDQRTDGSDVFWTRSEKLLALTESLKFWQSLTGQYGLTYTLDTTGLTPFLSVPRQMASVQRITSNGSPLTPTSLHELDTGFSGWETSGIGTPNFWAPCGVNEVAIYPWTTVTTLVFYGYSDLDQLNEADFINIGNEELTYLLDYAGHYLSFKSGFSEINSTTSAIQRMVTAAGFKNARLQSTNMYKRWLGLDRQEAEKPLGKEPVVGVRV